MPPGAYGMPQQAPYGTQPAVAQRREPLPHYRGQPLRIDTPQGRPILTEDDRSTAGSALSASTLTASMPSATNTSPDNKLSPNPYTPSNPFPTPISAQAPPSQVPFSERKEYQRVPPLHDLTRRGPGDPDTPHPHTSHPPPAPAPQPQSHPPLPQINILHPTRSNSPTSQPPVTSNVQVAAQLALSHAQFPTSNRARTQKEEMLAGRQYYPFDKELVLERERCSAACWRFNNSTNPNNGVSPNERARLFREILQPRDPIQISPTNASPVTNVGRVGENVVVEAPFVCDYGYNITIGQNVIIGRNCTILDTCEVKIGDNCHIGPNVSLYTASLPIDPKRRMGSKGPQLGKPITIEPDCWIGGGVTILPGRTVGRGSTVGAGSVVVKVCHNSRPEFGSISTNMASQDVPPFTIVGGNPIRVIRGIASG